MRRVLLVAYHFPPVGGAGVQRAVKLARYLPRFGWEVTILSGPGPLHDRWTPTDASLAAELPPETATVRVAGPEPAPPGRWRARAERWLGVPGAWERWWQDGIAGAGREAWEGADAILVTMSPFASADGVARLADAIHRPWIADLRDPWALDEMVAYPSWAHRRRAAADMRRALAGAAAIVMNTPEAARRVRTAFPELAPRVVDAIPNGFDPDDFTAGQDAGEAAGAFRIVHAGYLHTALRHGGPLAAVRRKAEGIPYASVDRSARSLVHLMPALERLSRAGRPIELHLAGVLSDADRRTIPASVTVRHHGYLSHADSVRLVQSAHLLFLPMHDLPRGVRATIVPGKTYEYLGSGRPILAAVPDGDARDLLEHAAGVHVCRPADSAAMAAAVESELDVASPCDHRPARAALLAPLSRERIAGRMAAVLDGVAPGAASAASEALAGRLARPLG